MDSDSVVNFPPNNWHAYLDRRDAIAALLDARCHNIEWLDACIIGGACRVFASDAAVIVVMVKQYPAGATELHGLVAAGDLEAILPLIDDAEHWARENGVTFASIASRQGWERVLKDRGYRLYKTELRKEL